MIKGQGQMVSTRVVNIRAERHDVYIGRNKDAMHFGNPFALKRSDLSNKVFPNRKDALMAFFYWLNGTDHQEVEPARREWVIANMENLRGKTLGCFCKPKECHGDIYRVVLGEMMLEDVFVAAPAQKHSNEEQINLF